MAYKDEQFGKDRNARDERFRLLRSLGIRDVIRGTDIDGKGGVLYYLAYPADTKILTVEATGTVEEPLQLPEHTELGGEG